MYSLSLIILLKLQFFTSQRLREPFAQLLLGLRAHLFHINISNNPIPFIDLILNLSEVISDPFCT